MSIKCLDQQAPPLVTEMVTHNFIETLNDKSIQGMIFDQDTIQGLKGDEDQQNTMRTGNVSLQEEVKQAKQFEHSISFQIQEKDKLNSISNDFLNNKTKSSEVDCCNKVLLSNQSTQQKQKQYESPFIFELENAKNQEAIIDKQNMNYHSHCQVYSKYKDLKHVKDDKEVLVAERLISEHKSIDIGGNNQQNTILSNTQQNETTTQRKFYLENKNSLNIVEGEICKNYEKASQIINKVFGKSLNRAERVSSHIQNFLQQLKYRKKNRKIPTFNQQEDLLINDVASYTHQKLSQITCFQQFLTYSYFLFSKLNIPKIPVFLPTSTLKVYQDIFQVFFTYTFLYIYSILIFFAKEEQDSVFIQQLFKVSFFVFLFEMLANFNTAYFDKDIVIVDKKKIIWKYLSSIVFLTDSINLFIMGYKIIFESNQLVYNPGNELNTFIVNLLTFLKLNGIKQKRNRFSQVFTLKKNQKHIVRLLNQLLSVVTVAHIVSLAWYTLGVEEMQNNYAISWIQKYNLVNLSYLEKYIYSLYWSVTTMTTVGYGDISACNYIEALFITIAMIIFSCVFAYSINNIGFILQEIEKTSKQLNDNITAMQRKNVNISLQSRVRHYLTFLAEEQNDRDQQVENDILGILSNKLRDEITVEINTRILRNHANFVANFSEQTLRKLVFLMEEVMISPNEIIFEEEDHDDQSIYFIESGVIEIYQHPVNKMIGSEEKNRTHILQTLGQSQLFGDISFFSGLARKASARSVNLSTLYRINRNDFITLIQDFPEDFERFKMIEEQILFQNDITPIFIQCYACNLPGHIAMNCPRIHQAFDTQFNILRENFSIFQQRGQNQRRHFNKFSKNAKLLINRNGEYYKILKENLRNYNSYTEEMFHTDIEITTFKSDIKNKTSSSSSSSSSSSNSDSEPSSSSHQVNQEYEEQSSQKISSESYHENKSGQKLGSMHINSNNNNNNSNNNNLNNNEKIMSQNKINSFKMITAKPKKTKKKDDNSIKNLSSFREIDNLENLLLQEQTPLQMIKKTSQNAQNEDIYPIQCNSVNERQSEISMKELQERNQEDITNSHQLNKDNIKISGFSVLNNINSVPQPSSQSLKHCSHQNVFDLSNEEQIREDRKEKQKKKAQSWKQNMKSPTLKPEEINEDLSSAQSIDDKLKLKSNTFQIQKNSTSTDINIAQKPNKVVSKCSLDKLLTNVMQTVQLDCVLSLINSSSVIAKIEKSLSKVDENLQSFASLKNTRSLKSMKLVEQFSSHKRITTPLQTQYSTTLKNKSNTINTNNADQEANQKYLERLQTNINMLELQNTMNLKGDKGDGTNNKNVQFLELPQQEQQLEQPPQRSSQQQLQLMNKIYRLLTINGGHQGNTNHHLLRDQTIIDNANVNLSITVESFDKMKNFKKFFPHNNFIKILHSLRTKKSGNKILKGKGIQSNFKARRQKILIQNPQHLQTDLYQMLLSKHSTPTYNPQMYKPTYLSYGVSQKSESIYPRNIIRQQFSISQ